MKTKSYETITSRKLSLDKLSELEKRLLGAALDRFGEDPGWTAFASWWVAAFRESGLSKESIVYRVCQDLEARLGIAQGRVAPPDYRDYLADLIEDRFGTRYRFCKATGVDPGHLSRVLASRSDLSVAALNLVLDKLGASLVIQPKVQLVEALSQPALHGSHSSAHR